jgi:hypothetical protein
MTHDPPAASTGYAAFWPIYLGAHRRPATRMWHFAGTTLGLATLVLGLVLGDWRIVAGALAVGYLPAWLSHFLVEGNRPATFGHPLWSLASDFRMYGLWLTGRLERELRRHDIRPVTGI